MGFDEDFVDMFDEKCLMCLQVPQDAVAHDCGKLFCSSCWASWMTKSNQCPNCREQGTVAPAHRDRMMIRALKIRCKQCLEVFPLSQHENHCKNNCKHREIICEKCNVLTTYYRQTNNMHACVVKCQKCMLQCYYFELMDHQAQTCTNHDVRCSFCQKDIELTKLYEHSRNHIIELQTRVLSLENMCFEFGKYV